MPFQREAAAILEEWRAVQLELEKAHPESNEADALRAEGARLRDVYLRLTQQQRETGGMKLPPLPDEEF